jgi:hypothetical protein
MERRVSSGTFCIDLRTNLLQTAPYINHVNDEYLDDDWDSMKL